MKTLATGWALGMAMVLAGCAMPVQETEQERLAAAPASAPAAGNAPGQDDHQMTGSRIPKRTSTDRSLKTVGARGARDALEQAPRPLNSSGGG